MVHLESIDSLDHAELAPYRTMREQRDHHRQRIFVAEGEKVVRRLLESHLTVISALLPEKWFHQLEELFKSRPEKIRIFLAEKERLEKLTGFSMYQGVLAVGEIPAPASLQRVLENAPRPRLFVATDGINNSENLGVLIRNCAAFGVQALVSGETSSSPYMRRAVRSSMGAIFNLPVIEPSNLVQALAELRARGLRCVAAHPHEPKRTLARANLAEDCCLVFGSEGLGIRPEVLAACDEAAVAPMHNAVDSLNVGSAAAIFLYEANRQRGKT